MLEPIERAPMLLRVEFPVGEHEGECYEAQLGFCPNPTCRCGTVYLTLTRDPGEQPEARIAKPYFEVDILESRLTAPNKKDLGDYDPDLGKAFVAQLTTEDWQLLRAAYYTYKERITAQTPDRELITDFPAAEIEGSKATVAFHEILPFGEAGSIDLDDRHFLLEDQYCVQAGCGCTETFVTLVAAQAPGLPPDPLRSGPTLVIDYRNGRDRVAESDGENRALLKRMAAKLLSKEMRTFLEKRHQRLRSLYELYKQAHQQQPRRVATRKVGRNDPCPCGSGKKYKKCCMRTEEQQGGSLLGA